MKRIYILQEGTYLRKDGEHLNLIKNNKVVDEISLSHLKHLTLIGYTSLSGAVLNELFKRRIETVLLDPRGRFRGKICLDEHKHVKRRIAQYLAHNNENTKKRIAATIVEGKLKNQAKFLIKKGHQLKNQKILEAASAIRSIAITLKNVEDLDIIRGAEGMGSRLYFSVFSELISNSDFKFSERNKRPPKDPVNALLSFVYTLITSEVLTAINIVGLDPYLGFLHEIEYGRPSLACDLVEEWRAFLGDRFVLKIINLRAIKKEDFVYRKIKDLDFVDESELKQKRPVEMKPSTCRALISAYEKWMAKKIKDTQKGDYTSYRNLIQRQVARFENYLLGETKNYSPFLW